MDSDSTIVKQGVGRLAIHITTQLKANLPSPPNRLGSYSMNGGDLVRLVHLGTVPYFLSEAFSTVYTNMEC